MTERTKWVDRKFDFSFPVDAHPELLERLRGTPARLEDRTRALPRDLLTRRAGDKWSIQEHAGHLVSVEALFMGRLDDYDAGSDSLRPADVTGKRTYDANYNETDIASILVAFRAARMNLVARLQRLDDAGFARTALHPRLNRPMRLCDMMLFEAEHDDYHLARITDLIRKFGGPA
jgi:uncharacterized damage-inducible protein DinB